jgi:hypothetical protein
MENGTIQNRKERTNMGRDFTQEHIIKLHLPPELYLAVIKFQIQKELIKSYAGLLLVTKAAYQEKLITKEIYEKYLYRYSRKLVPEEEPQNGFCIILCLFVGMNVKVAPALEEDPV